MAPAIPNGWPTTFREAPNTGRVMAPDLHKHGPVCFRPACDEDRAWLDAETVRTGQSVYAVLARVLHDRASQEEPQTDGASGLARLFSRRR